MLVDLKHRLDQYNSEQEDTIAKIERTDDGQVVIAICSPVMKRLHTRLKKSGEMIFVDSSGNCDRQYQWIFLLLTHSTAGGLPLGVFITTSESQSTITSGLKLLQSLLPTGSFFWSGTASSHHVRLLQGTAAVPPDSFPSSQAVTVHISSTAGMDVTIHSILANKFSSHIF